MYTYFIGNSCKLSSSLITDAYSVGWYERATYNKSVSRDALRVYQESRVKVKCTFRASVRTETVRKLSLCQSPGKDPSPTESESKRNYGVSVI